MNVLKKRLRKFKSKDSEVYEKTLNFFTRLGLQAVPTMLFGLDHEDWDIALGSYITLTQLNREEIYPIARKVACNGNEQQRGFALFFLSEDKEFVEDNDLVCMLEQLNSESLWVRMCACSSLGRLRIPTPQTTEILLDALKSGGQSSKMVLALLDIPIYFLSSLLYPILTKEKERTDSPAIHEAYELTLRDELVFPPTPPIRPVDISKALCGEDERGAALDFLEANLSEAKHFVVHLREITKDKNEDEDKAVQRYIAAEILAQIDAQDKESIKALTSLVYDEHEGLQTVGRRLLLRLQALPQDVVGGLISEWIENLLLIQDIVAGPASRYHVLFRGLEILDESVRNFIKQLNPLHKNIDVHKSKENTESLHEWNAWSLPLKERLSPIIQQYHDFLFHLPQKHPCFSVCQNIKNTLDKLQGFYTKDFFETQKLIEEETLFR